MTSIYSKRFPTLKTLTVLLAFATAWVSLSTEGFAQSAVAELAAPTVVKDIPYKAQAPTEYERQRCKLDFYLPSEAEDFPTLVWFHGGGLQGGEKTDDIAVGLAERFSSEGIAVASANYRLSPKAKFPAYIDDAAAAVAFVRRTIGDRGGNPDLVFVSGHSAGGYLTAMVGMDPQYLQKYELRPEQIAGYIPVAGQMVTHSTVREERGIPRDRPLIDAAAAAYHVRAEAAPFLCIAGSNDLPCRAEENRYFVAAMRAVGHNAIEYLEAEGRDHGTVASEMDQAEDVVALAIKDFIQSADTQD